MCIRDRLQKRMSYNIVQQPLWYVDEPEDRVFDNLSFDIKRQSLITFFNSSAICACTFWAAFRLAAAKFSVLSTQMTVSYTHLAVYKRQPLVWPNECARHKLLDVIGDLALIGKPIKGRIIATRPGHTINKMCIRDRRYMMRGVSASKEDVHNAIKNIDKEIGRAHV